MTGMAGCCAPAASGHAAAALPIIAKIAPALTEVAARKPSPGGGG